MKTQRQVDLAKIHIAKKQIGMDDETYRAMLGMVAGVNSAGKLDARGRRAVLAHLRNVGFKAGRKKKRYPGCPDFEKYRGTGKDRMLKKIEAYLAEAKRPWSYAHGIAKQMFGIERVQWCAPEELRSIIAALEKDALRHGRHTGR